MWQMRVRGYPDTIRYWWQAHVLVEEAPSVENYYGFSVTVEGWNTREPKASGNFWEGHHGVPDWARTESESK